MPKREPVSKRTRFEVFKRDGFRCRYCGAAAPDVRLNVDHVLAVAFGGTNSISNLVTACWDCNIGKAAVSLFDRAGNDFIDRAMLISAELLVSQLRSKIEPLGKRCGDVEKEWIIGMIRAFGVVATEAAIRDAWTRSDPYVLLSEIGRLAVINSYLLRNGDEISDGIRA